MTGPRELAADLREWMSTCALTPESHYRLSQIAAALDTLPAAPVGELEQACAWLDARGLRRLLPSFVQRVDDNPPTAGWECGVYFGPTLSACIIATARALGWQPVTAPVERRLPVIATCDDCRWPDWDEDRQTHYCDHEDAPGGNDLGDEAAPTPPDWCPLRKDPTP